MADELEEVIDVDAEEVTEPEGEAQSAPEGAPVIAAVQSLERLGAHSLPAVRAAAVAATGFAAGAAAAALVRRRSARRLGRARGETGEGLALLSTHTYLIRVQVLGRPAE